MSELQSYALESIIQGYHVYKEVWEASIGQILPCRREAGNIHDPYAVAVVEQGVFVGRVPRAISSLCHLFPRRNVSPMCEVTGRRRFLYSEYSYSEYSVETIFTFYMWEQLPRVKGTSPDVAVSG